MQRKPRNARGRGRGGANARYSPSQRTLFDYIKKPDTPVSSASQPTYSGSTPLTPADDEEEKFFETTRQMIQDLVARHQLNELANLFRMRDRLRFSNASLKRLYFIMQDEVAREFGAPLSPSLFPEEIFEDFGNSQASQNPAFEC